MVGDADQCHGPQLMRVAGRTGRQQNPRGQDGLAGQSEAQTTWLLAVYDCGRRDHFSDQIVCQQSHPQFPTNHVRRLATDVVQAQGLLDHSDIQLHAPSQAV